MKYINSKKKGYTIQIVLSIFLVMIQLISYSVSNLMITSNAINSMSQVDESRLLEVLIVGYFKYEVKYGLLLSDEITNDDVTVYYTVDDMGSNFIINCRITNKEHINKFKIKIEKDTAYIKEFNYSS